MGTYKETSLGYWKLRLQTWEINTDIVNNRSQVGYRATLISTSGMAQYNGAGSIHIYFDNKEIHVSNININVMTVGGSQVLCESSTLVAHNNDGTKKLKVGAWYQSKAGAYYLPNSGSIDDWLGLSNIPRATEVSVDMTKGTTLGDTITVKGTPHVQSFSHKILFRLEGQEETETVEIKSGAQSISYGYTIPLGFAEKIINSEFGQLNIRLETYNGDSLIGSSAVHVNVKVPNDYVPTIDSITITDTNTESYKKFKEAVVGVSSLAFGIKASGSHGSSVIKYTTSVDAKTYEGANFTTDTIVGNGLDTSKESVSLTYTVIITDSRGRSASKSYYYVMLTHNVPQIMSFKVLRADDSYTVDENDGTYALITYTYTSSRMLNMNQIDMIIKYKPKSSDSWKVLNEVKKAAYTTTDATYHGGAILEPTNDYDFVIGLKDSITTDYVYMYTEVDSTYTLINYANSGKATSFFKQSMFNVDDKIDDESKDALSNWLETHGDSYFSEIPMIKNSHTDDEKQAHEKKLEKVKELIDDIGVPMDKFILNKVYPIGSIYISVSDANPTDLFGGTWQRFAQGRTLVGVGKNNDGINTKEFEVNGIGGEYVSSHINLGSRGYGINAGASGYYDRFVVRDNALNGDEERSAQISLMQPYIVVYMWQRTG